MSRSSKQKGSVVGSARSKDAKNWSFGRDIRGVASKSGSVPSEAPRDAAVGQTEGLRRPVVVDTTEPYVQVLKEGITRGVQTDDVPTSPVMAGSEVGRDDPAGGATDSPRSTVPETAKGESSPKAEERSSPGENGKPKQPKRKTNAQEETEMVLATILACLVLMVKVLDLRRTNAGPSHRKKRR